MPPLQTVNMGQGGYGVDQDYLWYKRDGVKLDANMLVFAVIAQDFFRMASDNFIGYGKPVLRARDGALVTENVPVPPGGRRARCCAGAHVRGQPGHRKDGTVARGRCRGAAGGSVLRGVGDDVFAAAGLAFDDLRRLSQSRGQRFVVAYLPVRDLLGGNRAARPPGSRATPAAAASHSSTS